MWVGTITAAANEDRQEDFASIERVVTEQNNVRLAASQGAQTRGDYFWAAVLALRAATGYGLRAGRGRYRRGVSRPGQ